MYNIWKLNYWFNWRPEPLPNITLILLVILAVACLAIYFLLPRLKNHKGWGGYHKLFKKIGNFSLFNAFAAPIFALLSWQLIPILSARAWFALYLAANLYWLYRLTIHYFKVKRHLANPNRSNLIKLKYQP